MSILNAINNANFHILETTLSAATKVLTFNISKQPSFCILFSAENGTEAYQDQQFAFYINSNNTSEAHAKYQRYSSSGHAYSKIRTSSLGGIVMTYADGQLTFNRASGPFGVGTYRLIYL